MDSMDSFDQENIFADLAWTMFAANGNPGFYMLYHDVLNGGREDDERLR